MEFVIIVVIAVLGWWAIQKWAPPLKRPWFNVALAALILLLLLGAFGVFGEGFPMGRDPLLNR